MTRETKQRTARLFALHEFVRAYFTKADWFRVAYLTDNVDLIEDHPRLLRSLDFRDDDYDGNSLQVLSKLIGEGTSNLTELERYVDSRKASLSRYAPVASAFVSTVQTRQPERVVTFAPDVFSIPDKPVESNMLSVMMPFEGRFTGTYTAPSETCVRVWESTAGGPTISGITAF